MFLLFGLKRVEVYIG